ncbi:hypothetical protein EMIT051CA3_90015 [Pseudomonas chlororaphis]
MADPAKRRRNSRKLHFNDASDSHVLKRGPGHLKHKPMQTQDPWTKVDERAEPMALHQGEPAGAFA